jgi:hypothetical protein
MYRYNALHVYCAVRAIAATIATVVAGDVVMELSDVSII